MFMAITYHAIYNTIVMSDYKYFGFALPFITYIPINVVLRRRAKELKKKKAELQKNVPEEWDLVHKL